MGDGKPAQHEPTVVPWCTNSPPGPLSWQERGNKKTHPFSFQEKGPGDEFVRSGFMAPASWHLAGGVCQDEQKFASVNDNRTARPEEPPSSGGVSKGAGWRKWPVAEHSFLRRADPRTKLLVSVAASAGLMLPLPQLAAIFAGYFILITAAGLGRDMVVSLRRTAVFLIVLCAVDWLCVGFDFAVLVALRLVLLVTSFTVFFATTTPDELQAALEYIRVPARLAFTFATAYRFVALFGTEWRGIVEAQRARGIVLPALGWRGWHEPRQQLTKAVGLVVPAVVLATQRAWSINEAAAARGFDSPHRSSSRRLRLTRLDHVLLTATVGLWVALLACR